MKFGTWYLSDFDQIRKQEAEIGQMLSVRKSHLFRKKEFYFKKSDDQGLNVVLSYLTSHGSGYKAAGLVSVA